MISANNGNYLLRVDTQHRIADTVGWFVYRYLSPLWRVQRHIDVVYSAQRRRESSIQFYYNLVCHLAERRYVAYCRSENNLTLLIDIARLYDSEIRLRHKTVANILRRLGQMHIEIVAPVRIDLSAQILLVLIRCAKTDSVRFG